MYLNYKSSKKALRMTSTLAMLPMPTNALPIYTYSIWF